MKQFRKQPQSVEVIHKPDSSEAGNFEIVRADHIRRERKNDDDPYYAVLYPEKLQGLMLHYATRLHRPKETVEKMAQIITGALSKSSAQLEVESLAGEMADIILILDNELNVIPKATWARVLELKKRIPNDLARYLEE